MENLDFVFYSEPQNRFPLRDADGDPLDVVLDGVKGMLRISGDREAAFALVRDGEPQAVAVFVTRIADGPQVLEIGTVDFRDQAQYLEDFSLTDENDITQVQMRMLNGGIAIADIRNTQRLSHTSFDLEAVPLALSISGIYLRVSTLRYDASSARPAWYHHENYPS